MATAQMTLKVEARENLWMNYSGGCREMECIEPHVTHMLSETIRAAGAEESKTGTLYVQVSVAAHVVPLQTSVPIPQSFVGLGGAGGPVNPPGGSRG